MGFLSFLSPFPSALDVKEPFSCPFSLLVLLLLVASVLVEGERASAGRGLK